MEEEFKKLEEEKLQLIAYLKSKTSVGDWHAVQDAASDIREINAVLRVLYNIDSEMRKEFSEK